MFCYYKNASLATIKKSNLCMLKTACKTILKTYSSWDLCCTDGIQMIDCYGSKRMQFKIWHFFVITLWYNKHAKVDHELNVIELHLSKRTKLCIAYLCSIGIHKNKAPKLKKTSRMIGLARMLLPKSGWERYEFRRIYG